MMFATTFRNRVIVAAGATGILAAGGLGIITPTAAYATESLAPVSLATATSSVETANLSGFPCPLVLMAERAMAAEAAALSMYPPPSRPPIKRYTRIRMPASALSQVPR